MSCKNRAIHTPALSLASQLSKGVREYGFKAPTLCGVFTQAEASAISATIYKDIRIQHDTARNCAYINRNTNAAHSPIKKTRRDNATAFNMHHRLQQNPRIYTCFVLHHRAKRCDGLHRAKASTPCTLSTGGESVSDSICKCQGLVITLKHG